MRQLKIGLALSGGGSRAIAFHLGCLRALHDRGLLDRISVLSAVSGGSVIAALYSYNDEPFDKFEARVQDTLSRGLVRGIAFEMLLPPECFRIATAFAVVGTATALAKSAQLLLMLVGLFGLRAPSLQSAIQRFQDFFPRFASRTTAFERHLRRRYFGKRRMPDVKRKGLAVVLNAAELRTETAFRFGSSESGCWRFGRLTVPPQIATAVAASAAFPALLPAIDRCLEFVAAEKKSHHRVIVTDGGVYDNFGISCMLPGKSSAFSTNAFPVDFIIACDAGLGMPSGARRPVFWPSRMMATIATIHRRTQTMSQDLLHRMAANGEIVGFVMPYLGQIDSRLSITPGDLVTREQTYEYPTDFNPMLESDIFKLSKRGEQLTCSLLDTHAPFL